MKRLKALHQKLWGHRVGFTMTETMKGTHRFVRDFPPTGVRAGAEHPLHFEVTWGSPGAERFFNPLSGEFCKAELEGRVTAGGLCQETPVQGTLELGYLKDATLRYAFEFAAHGQRFEYRGEKRGIRPWNLHRTHTTCYGAITALESGALLSESVVYFEISQLPRFLASLKIR